MGVFRTDTVRLDKFERTGNGGVAIPAVLTRAGVFKYRTDTGREILELRPPEEVHSPESVASLGDVPVTIGHPPGGVSPANWAAESVGHVRGQLRKDEATNGVAATLIVSRQDAQARIAREDADREALRDISPGYHVDIDQTPGTHPVFGRYDQVQRNIRYNHIALIGRGQGRQGESVGLRLDATGNEIREPAEEKKPKMKITLRLDGKDVEVEAGSAEHLNAQARIDATRDAQIASLTSDRDKEKARADKADAELATFRADAAKAARATLEASAKTVLGAEATFKADETDRQIKERVILKLDANAPLAGKPDPYVDARFDLACEAVKVKPAAEGSDRQDAITTGLTGGGSHAREDAREVTAESNPDAYIAQQRAKARNLHTAGRK